MKDAGQCQQISNLMSGIIGKLSSCRYQIRFELISVRSSLCLYFSIQVLLCFQRSFVMRKSFKLWYVLIHLRTISAFMMSECLYIVYYVIANQFIKSALKFVKEPFCRQAHFLPAVANYMTLVKEINLVAISRQFSNTQCNLQ